MPRRTLGSTRPYSSPLSGMPDRARRKRPVGGGWYRGPAGPFGGRREGKTFPRRPPASPRPSSPPLRGSRDRPKRKPPVGGGGYRGPASMTHKKAQGEAIRRGGEGGTATFRPGAKGK